MIKTIDSTRFGQMTFAITEIGDVAKLSKKGYTTGSTAILYGVDGSIRIWNFIENIDPDLNGQWVEMV